MMPKESTGPHKRQFIIQDSWIRKEGFGGFQLEPFRSKPFPGELFATSPIHPRAFGVKLIAISNCGATSMVASAIIRCTLPTRKCLVFIPSLHRVTYLSQLHKAHFLPSPTKRWPRGPFWKGLIEIWRKTPEDDRFGRFVLQSGPFVWAVGNAGQCWKCRKAKGDRICALKAS